MDERVPDENPKAEGLAQEQQPSDDKMETRDIVTLSAKKLEEYEQKVVSYISKLTKIISNAEEQFSIFQQAKDQPHADQSLAKIRDEIVKQRAKFDDKAESFCQYLQRIKSPESRPELASQEVSMAASRQKIAYFLNDIDTFLKPLQETMEHKQDKKDIAEMGSIKAKSKHSKRRSNHSSSTRSRLSTGSIVEQRIKSESAKCKLEFAEMEAKLKIEKLKLEEEESLTTLRLAKQKQELDINIGLLNIKREAKEAEIEYNIACEELSDGSSSNRSSVKQSDIYERTKDYVFQMNDFIPKTDTKVDIQADIPENILNTDVPQARTNEAANYDNITFDSSAPQHHCSMPMPIHNNSTTGTVATEMARLFMKKDILMSRLTQFSDKAEHYLIWKAKFLGIMKDLQVTPTEELDLLVRWLGPESSNQALRMQASHPTNPNMGIKRVWDRLDERYGAPELVEAILKDKLQKFQKIGLSDSKRMYELSDLIAEIQAVKENPKYATLFGYFDSSTGVNPIVSKLPSFMQGKWTDRAAKYKAERGSIYPPFTEFAKFIHEMSLRLNDPSFKYDHGQSYTSRSTNLSSSQQKPKFNTYVTTRKTEVHAGSTGQASTNNICPLHESAKHSLNECRSFRRKPIEERKSIISRNGICFRCCLDKHLARDCKEQVVCGICNKKGHPDALHIEKRPDQGNQRNAPTKPYGGERQNAGNATQPNPSNADLETQVSTNCTQICGKGVSGKSCAKTILVNVFPENHPERSKRIYVVVDDQSNRSLVKTQFFNMFNAKGQDTEYSLSCCAGKTVVSGRKIDGFTIESLDGQSTFQLPTLLECNQIPSVRDEIPTPNVTTYYEHLQGIKIPPIDEEAEILMLIGRDLVEAHHIIDQRIGPKGTPFAQKLALGWVIIGETCLGKVHISNHVNANKTFVLANGRTSICKPCTSDIKVQEHCDIAEDIFIRTKDDDKIGQSVEDKEFLKIMENGFRKSDCGRWSAPLPFRSNRQPMPNNYQYALQRARKLDLSLKQNVKKREHFCEFMKKIFDNGHAEKVPKTSHGEEKECWYLPIFGVYHPKKPDKIRVVFDSAAKYEGVCLNDTLLKGPDLTNNLVGVLLRFRSERIALTADIEQMFFNFLVHKQHRDFLRFLWYEDNNPERT
uniref:Uncharacterized protein LOC111117241 n=1 Tax=Crassostrea virginica TaxID=6565 RepID=A0A8B8CA57_CRAVI|nr:uncharacterized protein LOC111117241 [Crassostrea virginica]